MDKISSGLSYPAAPAREKYWDEKNPEEKANKLGESFEYLVKEVRNLRQELEALKNHGHNSKDEITIPLHNLLKDAREESYFFKNPLGREKPFWKW